MDPWKEEIPIGKTHHFKGPVMFFKFSVLWNYQLTSCLQLQGCHLVPTPVTYVTYVLVGKVHHSLEVQGFGRIGWMTRESQQVILRLK